MKKHKRRPSAFRAIALRVICLALVLWLCSMALLTWAVAAHTYQQLEFLTNQHVLGYNERVSQSHDSTEELPGNMEINTINAFGRPQVHLSLLLDPLLPIQMSRASYIDSGDWIWGKWNLYYGMETAEIVYDTQQQILAKSGSYLTFAYTTQDHWKSRNVDALGLAYIDLETVEGGVQTFRNLLIDHAIAMGSQYFLPVLRLTGYFEGNAFRPVVIDRGLRFDMDPDVQLLCQQDAQNALQWENLFTATGQKDYHLETIYAWDVTGNIYDHNPLSVNGMEFDSLTQLLHTDWTSQADYECESLVDAIIICRMQHTDSYGSYVYALAVRCWPLQHALAGLWHIYLICFAAVGLCVYFLLRGIRKKLTFPLENIAEAIEYGSTVIPSDSWKEIHTIERYYADSRQSQAEENIQLQQLRTALEYAQNAEEHRRQLVSNITHELKTPLAVIHSYAEGLREGISAEKTDQYLTVISDETERMDAMVQQMLELSRLEAGKVRLAAEPFSLLQLSRQVTETFAPFLAAKALQLRFVQAEDFLITADEARIRQVLTNLVSNAVKYTPDGGKIFVKVYLYQKEAFFEITNTTDPLPEEALKKVWDSFYRVDPSRAEPGTGLGLALVKSIVELHQGTCFVYNTNFRADGQTESGVKFAFKLPMGG